MPAIAARPATGVIRPRKSLNPNDLYHAKMVNVKLHSVDEPQTLRDRSMRRLRQ